jgi:hypothetical protein
MARVLAGLGAVVFVLWGVTHLLAAQQAYALGLELEAGIVQGRVFQDAFFLAFFAVVTIVTGAGWSWRNSLGAYWINVAATSAADIPFITFLVMPGYVTPPASVIGPALWIAGVMLSTAAIVSARRASER